MTVVTELCLILLEHKVYINTSPISMKQVPFYFSIFIIAMLISCRNQPGKTLIWADEFDYVGAPDSTKWNFDLGDGCPNACGWGNNEAQFYTKDLKNARVENGRLIIEARKDSQGGKVFTSARMVTKMKGDWRYGRIEVKAKLPRGKGTWPAIWMLSTDWKYGGWPESGEIDIMEHVGYDPGVIHGTIHTDFYNQHFEDPQKGGKVMVADAQDEFHVYAIRWTVDKLEFLVDDKRYHVVNKGANDTFRKWPFDQRFHLILNIAVGGNWGGKEGIDDLIWPQQMEVDWVRVYQ
jgi:beta-glucanase (GH16 family)